MVGFYTMESVRDQIKGIYPVHPIDIPDTWNRYPCKIEPACEAKRTQSCSGYVEIEVNKPNFSTALIEILFFRPRKIAFIREGNKQLRKLIALNIIDSSKLVPVI
jgi:hypothetical protein